MEDPSGAPSRGDILVVDDSPANLTFLLKVLGGKGYCVRPVLSGASALEAARAVRPDLLLLDIAMPEMDGFEVCRRMKADPSLRDVPIIFLSAHTATQEKLKAFRHGGLDYITKPFQVEEVEVRVETHLRLRRAQVELEHRNRHLAQLVEEKVKDISESQMATIFAMVKLAESRDDETGQHLWRVRAYCQALAQALRGAADIPPISDSFVRDLISAAPLHDIGKVGIPDLILLKPGRLTPEEFEIMKTHTTIGARTLEEVRQAYPKSSFIGLGVELAQSHHERWDGTGYPCGLAGAAIPLSAQIMALADVYDALRSPRRYKPSFDHAMALRILTRGDARAKPTQFNPALLSVFLGIAGEFDAIYSRFSG